MNHPATTEPLRLDKRMVQQAVRDFFRNEVLPKTAAYASESEQVATRTEAMRWLEAEIKAASQEVLGGKFSKGGDGLIRDFVRDEIKKALGNRTSVSAMVEKIVREEARAIIEKSMRVSVHAEIEVERDPGKYEREAQF